jgi:hypothetical protein
MKLKKQYLLNFFVKVEKVIIKRMRIKSDRKKKLKNDEIIKTSILKTFSNKTNFA